MGKIIRRVRARKAMADQTAIYLARTKLNAEYDEVMKAHHERMGRAIFELQKPMFVRLIEWWIKWRG
jgi:hypothetical protein